MDGDIDGAPTLVDNLDHLLVGVALRHAYQSTELTDTMIDMHHIVADLELLDLLKCQCHLAGTCLVGAQVVLMETVEDLMVGKHAEAQVVVGKALVERFLDGGEDHARLPTFLPSLGCVGGG